jgi:hypothetical protein
MNKFKEYFESINETINGSDMNKLIHKISNSINDFTIYLEDNNMNGVISAGMIKAINDTSLTKKQLELIAKKITNK